MTAKEWLNRGWRIDREIRELERAQKEALNLATRITTGTDGERVGGTKANSSERNMVTYADKVTEYTALINKKIAELVEVKLEIFKAIYTLKDSDYRKVLIARYINFKKWELIADECNVDERYIFKIHDRAINVLNRTLKDSIKV